MGFALYQKYMRFVVLTVASDVPARYLAGAPVFLGSFR
jgi:hypothetical protein